MRKPWWRQDSFWAGVLTGLFFGALLVAAAVILDWRNDTRIWLGAAGFGAGAFFEWLRLGTRRYVALAAITAFLGIGWYFIPEKSRVDWFAPVRKAGTAVEALEFERTLELPDPPPNVSDRSGGGRALGAAAARVSRYTIEIHNAEGDALDLTYSAGATPRSLGRIPGGAIQRFTIAGTAGSTIQLLAAGSGGDSIRVSVRLDPNELLQVTLRRS